MKPSELLEDSLMAGNTHLLPNVGYYAVNPEKFKKALGRIKDLEAEVELYRGGYDHKESCPRYQNVTNRCDCGVLSKP